MPPMVDIAGQKFGKVTVREFAGRDKHGKCLWKCKCDCGRVFTVVGSELRSGNTKSCGCGKYRGKKPHDLTGRRFGMLTALEILPRRKKHGQYLRHGKYFWRCRCDCGRTASVSANQLTREMATSCGCKRLLTKRNAKREFEAKQEIRQNGKVLLMPGPAARYLKCSYHTLHKLWRIDCPALGEAIKPVGIKGPVGRTVDYYDKAQLDRAREALQKLPFVPKVEGAVYIGDAESKLGVSQRRVRALLAEAKAEPTYHPGKRTDGHFCWRTYVPEWFVDSYSPASKMARAPTDLNGASNNGRHDANGPPERRPGETDGAPAQGAIAHKTVATTEEHYEYSGHTRKAYATGRRGDPEVEAVLKFCYDTYIVQRKSKAQVLERVRKTFPKATYPDRQEHVKQASNRWASKFVPPLPLNRDPV
jgi:hypothetical protein